MRYPVYKFAFILLFKNIRVWIINTGWAIGDCPTQLMLYKHNI